jgi:hypothetical protein
MSKIHAGAALASRPDRSAKRLLVLAIVAGLVWAATGGIARADDDDEPDKATEQTTPTVAGDQQATTTQNDQQQQQDQQQQAAEAVNACTLTVPDLPLTARGLATPWVLGGCQEDNPDQGAFVEATILDPATGAMTIYRPLVVDQRGPALEPTVPRLPATAVVSINIGFQGDQLTLLNQVGIQEGRCVNGLPGDIFGQVAFCNNFNGDGTGFFEVADRMIADGTIEPPVPEVAADGRPCPTVWTYDITDQDPVDNTTTSYLVDGRGRTAQNIPANVQNVVFGQVITNGSDAALLANRIDPALPLAADPAKTCQSSSQFRATDITAGMDSTRKDTTLALQSLQAPVAAVQPDAPTQGLLSIGGPFVTTNGQPNLSKLNLYRQNVNQPVAATLEPGIEADATDEKFCRGLIGGNGLQKVAGLDKRFLSGKASPDPAAANDLFNFMMFRFVDNSFGPNALDCERKLGVRIADFLVLNADADGVVINAQVDLDGLRAASAKANAGQLPVQPLTLAYVPRGQAAPPPADPPPTTQPAPVLVRQSNRDRPAGAQLAAYRPSAAPAQVATGAQPAPVAAAAAGQPGAGQGALPFTGNGDPTILVLVGSALLSAGALLVMLNRRRYGRGG